MLKCDHCGIELDKDMDVNICLEGCGKFCSDCVKLSGGTICPMCYSETHPQEEIQDCDDEIDSRIDDFKERR